MAIVSSKLLRGCVAAILLAVLGFLGFQLLRPAKLPLTIVSLDPQMRISARCTVGTNHAYYVGGLWGRIRDPFPRKVSTVPQGDASFLRSSTDEQSTVVWVRFVHPGFGVGSSPRVIGRGATELFRAHLTRTNGETVALAQIGTVHQNFRNRYFVTGWAMPGKLDSYRGALIQIEFTNGGEAVTFKAP